jgi:hypothetical protein
MDRPQVVSRDEWLAARKELLAREKEATRVKDAVDTRRRALPMAEVDKDYVFAGPGGQAGLPGLFDGRRQLIVYHFMWLRDTDKSFWSHTMIAGHQRERGLPVSPAIAGRVLAQAKVRPTQGARLAAATGLGRTSSPPARTRAPSRHR